MKKLKNIKKRIRYAYSSLNGAFSGLKRGYLPKFVRRAHLAAGIILAFGVIVAGGVLVFSDFNTSKSIVDAESLQWTQDAGAGITVPACGSSTACGAPGQNVVCTTCSSGAPSVEFTWNNAGIGGDGTTCLTARIGVWVTGFPAVRILDNLPCSGNATWTGGANSTSYNYQVRYSTATYSSDSCTGGYDKSGNCLGWTTFTETRTYPYDRSVCTGGVDPKSGLCLGWTTITDYGHLINSGSFSTPNCTLPPVCSPASVSLNTGQAQTFSVSEGSAPFTWDAPSSSNPSGSGTTHNTSYSSAGSYAVTVTDSASRTSQCSVTVNPPPEPDLVIQSPALSPGSPIVGQLVTFSGTVANTGTGAAGASQTRVRVDLNNNGWTAGEPEFTNPTGAIAIGGTEAESFAPWTSVLGTHSYQICADSGSTVAESNEGNNCSAPQAFTVSSPPPQANLIIDPHSATPSSVVVGTNVTIQGTVRNQGGAGAGQSNTRLRVDIGSDGSWDTTQNAATGALASAGSELEQWILIVGSVGPRTYEICADSAGAVSESNEADNCVTGTYSGVNPPADLIIQSPSMNPGSPLVNQTVTFSGTVRNQGSTDAGSSQTRLFIDVSPSGAGSEDVSSDNPTGALAASVGTEIESYAWTAVFGNHTYQICADSTNVVSESDEGNNCTALIPFSVGVPVLSISLSASPPSPGIAPFSTTLTADITSYTGSPSDTINYSFWWNCNNSGTSVAAVQSVCGDPSNPANGFKIDNTLSDPQSTPAHTYSQGSYTAKIIIERNGAAPKEARIPIVVNWPAIGGSCAVPPSADAGDPVTWSALGTGGNGSYTYEWYSMTGSPSPATCAGQPSLACQNFLTSYGTNGTKSGNVRIRSASLTPYTPSCPSVNISGRIISFGGDPSVIFSGGTATLKWKTSGYSNGQCSIDNGIGVANPAVEGSLTTPALTTTTIYRITCDDGFGPESRDATVIVGLPPTFKEIPPN